MKLLTTNILLGALSLAASLPAQSFSTTTVQGTVYLANGQPGSGTLLLTWPAFTTAAGQAVAAGRLTAPIAADGSVTVNLAPNQGATPAGLYYTAVYHLADGSTSTEYWTVPAAPAATIAQVRAQIMPAAQAVQTVSRSYVDQAVGATLSKIGGSLSGPINGTTASFSGAVAAGSTSIDNAGVHFPDGTSQVSALSPSTVADPAAATATSNRRFDLRVNDASNTLFGVWNESLSPFTAGYVTTSWNFNSTYASGSYTASLGYGLFWTPAKTPFRLEGCPAPQWTALGTTYPNNLYAQCQRQLGAAPVEVDPVKFRGIVVSDWFDFIVKDAQTRWRVIVDGLPLSHYFQVTGNTGNADQVHIQLDGRQHNVEIEIAGPFGVFVSPSGQGSADFLAPAAPRLPIAVALGDSFTEPTITCAAAWCANRFWIASASYNGADILVDPGNNLQQVTTPSSTGSSATSGSSAPAWATAAGAVTTDGGLAWTNRGPAGPVPAVLSSTMKSYTSWFMRAANLLGWEYHNKGAGGTGFVASDNGLRVPYDQRIASDVCPSNPQIVVLQGSVNDATTANLAALTDAAQQTIADAAACPSHPVVLVTGIFAPQDPATNSNTAYAQAEADLQAAVSYEQAHGVNVFYVASPTAELWNTGNHANCATAVNATGNACRNTGADGTHPTTPGHDDLGAKFAARIAQTLPQLINAVTFAPPAALSSGTKWHALHPHPSSLNATISTTAGSSAFTVSQANIVQPGDTLWINDPSSGCRFSQLMTVAAIAGTSGAFTSNWNAAYGCSSDASVAFQFAMSPVPERFAIRRDGSLPDTTLDMLRNVSNVSAGQVLQKQSDGTYQGATVATGTVASVVLPAGAPSPASGAVASSAIFTTAATGPYVVYVAAWTTSTGGATAGTVGAQVQFNNGAANTVANGYGASCYLSLITANDSTTDCNHGSITLAIPIYAISGTPIKLGWNVGTTIAGGTPSFNYVYWIVKQF